MSIKTLCVWIYMKRKYLHTQSFCHLWHHVDVAYTRFFVRASEFVWVCMILLCCRTQNGLLGFITLIHRVVGWHSGNAVWLVFGRCSVQILARTLASLTEVFYGFLHSLQANAGLLSRFDHDLVARYSFQFIMHLSSCYLTQYSTNAESVIN